MIEDLHVSRHWSGPGPKEAECECPKAPCGLVVLPEAVCEEHHPMSGKTIRSGHRQEDCKAT